MLPSAWRVPMIVTVMLSFRSPVLPATVLETCTVLPNTTLVSHCVFVRVIEPAARSVTVPRATALEPGEGEGAPGLGHAAAKARPPPPAPPPPNALPPLELFDELLVLVVLALTLFWPSL